MIIRSTQHRQTEQNQNLIALDTYISCTSCTNAHVNSGGLVPLKSIHIRSVRFGRSRSGILGEVGEDFLELQQIQISKDSRPIYVCIIHAEHVSESRSMPMRPCIVYTHVHICYAWRSRSNGISYTPRLPNVLLWRRRRHPADDIWQRWLRWGVEGGLVGLRGLGCSTVWSEGLNIIHLLQGIFCCCCYDPVFVREQHPMPWTPAGRSTLIQAQAHMTAWSTHNSASARARTHTHVVVHFSSKNLLCTT